MLWPHDAYAKARAIGSGSFGQVCIAYNVTDGTEVAAKVFEVEEDSTMLLETCRELAILSALSCRQHPNIVQLKDICLSFDGQSGLVAQIMPLLCCSLESQIGAGSLSPERRARFLWQLLCAVDFLHASSIMHRDIKPGNVVLCANLQRAVLIDFSFARRLTEAITPSGQSKRQRSAGDVGQGHTEQLGTPTYTAPEILERKPYGLPSDIWSVGVCAFELLQDELLQVFKDKAALRHIQQSTSNMGNKPAAILLKAMLCVDPQERCTARGAQGSELFSRLALEPPAVKPLAWLAPSQVHEDVSRRAKAACALLGYKSSAAATAFFISLLPEHPDLYAATLAGKLYEGSFLSALDIPDVVRKENRKRCAPLRFSASEYANYEIEALRACNGNMLWDLQCM